MGQTAEWQTSERRLRQALESAPDATIVISTDGEIVFVSNQAERLFGYGREELLGRPLETLLPEPLRKKHAQHRAKYVAAPQSRPMGSGLDLSGRRKDGSLFAAEISLSPLEAEEGVQVLASIRDVTARKRNEEALKQRTGELAALNDLGRQVNASLSVREVVDATLAEVVASVAPDVAFLFLREGNALLLRGAGPEDSPYLHEDTPVHCVGECLCGVAAGERKPVYSADIHEDPRCNWSECKQVGLTSYAALPLRSGDEVLGVLGLGSGRPRDFAAQDTFLETLSNEVSIALHHALLHEEVRRHAAALEERVADRTADLAVAKDRAEEADRLKSAFLATMSHELRTPLNSIIGFTGILAQGLPGPLNDEQSKQLGMVRNSATHLLDLINDVLDISKIEAGQLEIVREPFDMREAITRVVNVVAPMAEDKGLGLRVDVGATVGTVSSDQRRVEQVLINLLNNAVKFTQKGEVCVRCEATCGQVVTRVVDTGIGIKPEHLARLFEPFQQLDVGLNRQHEGTGLGLSICKRLAEALGGETAVESTWGVGSTFIFTIPEGREEA
jgi:PAS domain S-box-containing protein